METRLGQVAPLVMVTEAIPSRLPLLSWRWKRVPRDPVRTPDVSSCPEWTSASKPSPRRTSCSCGLSCSCVQPRRAPDTPLTTPWILFWGGGSRAPVGVAGPRSWTRRPPAIMAYRVPRSAMTSSCVFRPGGPCPVILSMSVLRGLQSAHNPVPPPPSPVEPLRRRFRGGGELCQSCVVWVMCFPLVSIFGLFPVLV